MIHEIAIVNVPVDYGIHEGHRTHEKQLEYFLAGKSRIDPRVPSLRIRGKHLKNPSEATDIHVAEKGTTWQSESLSFVAGYLMAIARLLYDAGEIDHLLRWGGDWDRDGVIKKDQTFDDLPHLELYKPKQES